MTSEFPTFLFGGNTLIVTFFPLTLFVNSSFFSASTSLFSSNASTSTSFGGVLTSPCASTNSPSLSLSSSARCMCSSSSSCTSFSPLPIISRAALSPRIDWSHSLNIFCTNINSSSLTLFSNSFSFSPPSFPYITHSTRNFHTNNTLSTLSNSALSFANPFSNTSLSNAFLTYSTAFNVCSICPPLPSVSLAISSVPKRTNATKCALFRAAFPSALNTFFVLTSD
mmetsp:Transcript_11531/g.20861  ORF Transcript_11531/g.20861 Transcript_11531/m.20861 type:complete len:225 (-) Transcript_11531:1673-2347(-)